MGSPSCPAGARGFTKASRWRFAEVLNGLLLPSRNPPGSMAHLVRLIGLLLSLTFGSSHAASGVWTVGGTCANVSLGGAAACWVANANTAAGNVLPYWRYALGSVNEGAGTFVVDRQHCNEVSGCAAQTPVTQTGTFTPDPVDPGEEHCASIIGSPVKVSWTTNSPSLGTQTICQGGIYACTAVVTGDICGTSRSNPDGPYLCHGSGVSGGAPCTPSPTPETPPAPGAPPTDWPSAPPPGTCPGQINGVDVNVPCSSTSTQKNKATSENDGEGNTTQKSESKTTICTAAGSCTTTTTTTTTVNGGAPKTTTKTETEGKGAFCAGNPGSAECGDGDGSSFGGNCEASFQCTGDAVQCALTKEVHIQHCKLNKATDEAALYTSEKVKDGDQTGDLPGNETIPFGVGNYDDSNALGAGSCISDLTIENGWISATLPLSMVCGSLEWFRRILLALGGLVWLLIVFRK